MTELVLEKKKKKIKYELNIIIFVLEKIAERIHNTYLWFNVK